MLLRQAVEARPRSTMEILDDAWRTYFSEVVFLLALTSLLYLPAATSLFLLIVDPVYSAEAWLPPLAALLVPLTGLSAGACQEAFHSWAEDYQVSFWECLKAACQRGVYHVAAQAMSLIGTVAILACLIAPSSSDGVRIVGTLALVLLTAFIALFSFTLQPSFTAGKPRFWRAVRYSIQATGLHFGRALLFLILRPILMLFAVLNLHLFGAFALWVAEDLAGFDVAFLDVICSLDNGAYLLGLVLLVWCLAAPYNAAVSYLFFVDVRTRLEGLDLWQRVQDLFPERAVSVSASKSAPKGAPIAVSALALAIVLLHAAPVSAQEPLASVRVARKEVQVIRGEVKAADPYPGGAVWLMRLEGVADRLERSASNRDAYRWFRQELKGFPRLLQPEAVARLDNLDSQLEMVEESLLRPQQAPGGPSRDEIKSLIPPEKGLAKAKKTKVIEEKKKVEDDRERAENVEPVDQGFGKPAGPGIVGPTAFGGAASSLLVLLLGLGIAAVLAAIVSVIYSLWRSRTKDKPRQAGTSPGRAGDDMEDPTQHDPARLWRQADELARSGNYLAAVRTLYLAVLAVLHRGGMIRYQRTRTNGEYADQLRKRPPLHHPFVNLTALFELKWYGQRTCEPNDYRNCRELAEQVRVGADSST